MGVPVLQRRSIPAAGHVSLSSNYAHSGYSLSGRPDCGVMCIMCLLKIRHPAINNVYVISVMNYVAYVTCSV